jgi:hypothetical protein
VQRVPSGVADLHDLSSGEVRFMMVICDFFFPMQIPSTLPPPNDVACTDL